MITWLIAFILTQVLEVPIWLWAGRKVISSRGKNWLCALGASSITHPIIWTVFPWSAGNYVVMLIAAETFVVVVEASWAKWWGIPHPWRISLLANVCSWGIGTPLWYFFVEVIGVM